MARNFSRNGWIAATLLAAVAPVLALPAAFEGDWQIPGEKPGTVDAVVTLSRAGETFEGAVKSFTLAPGDDPDPRCTRCPEPQRGKPLRGLQVIWGLKPDGDTLADGYLLDPEDGKVYRCRLELAEGGKALRVRMYLGMPMLGVTETWRR